MFLASEIMLFGAFFTAFFYVRYTNYPVFPPRAVEFPVDSTGINTAILISSSFTMHWALVSIKRGNRRGLVLGLLFTLIMGLTFLGLQMREYDPHGDRLHARARRVRERVLLPHRPARPRTSSSARSCSRSALVRSAARALLPAKHMGVELSGIYWHFVDLVWVILYTLVYLLSNGARAPL